MPIKPIERRLIEVIRTDPRAAGMSDSEKTALLWLAAPIEKGGHEFNFRPGIADPAELGCWLGLGTEFARTLKALFDRGILVEQPGGFRFAGWLGFTTPRAIAARANGRRGGRPPAWVPDTTTTTEERDLAELVVVAPAPSGTKSEAERIAYELGKEAGMTDAKCERGVGHVDVLLRRGVTPEQIAERVRKVLRRPNLPANLEWGYFVGPITDAIPIRYQQPTREQAPSTLPPDEQAIAKASHDEWVAWANNGRVGPMPARTDVVLARYRAAGGHA